MKTLIAVSVVAVMALTSGAQAGGFFAKRAPILTNITGIVVGLTTRDINVLNGNTVAVGNNSSILSGIGNGLLGGGLLNGALNGNGILGIGGQNQTQTQNQGQNNHHHGW
ncbi:MAG: hypothetical protein JWR51_768 [Devosia sp.]|uniref:hypothetical protein n=1 Tax=Devosia sp. TaxID=1871048 RepID=UPI0026217C09|nr:hypothetical protein [Devosia sp.]MDB5527665.1 hypothetical protein [Devosia sp.]